MNGGKSEFIFLLQVHNSSKKCCFGESCVPDLEWGAVKELVAGRAKEVLGLRESSGNTWFKTLRSAPHFQWQSETTPERIKNDETIQFLTTSEYGVLDEAITQNTQLMHFHDKLKYYWLRELWSKVFVFFLQWLFLLLISFLEKVYVWECFHLAYAVVFVMLWRHRITKRRLKTQVPLVSFLNHQSFLS